MSRIHDALKRAEQERASSMGTHVETATEQEFQPVGPAPVQSVTTVMPTIGSVFSYETLLARCPQAQWSPDSKSMLFFDNDEHRPGTEQFRTLRSRLYQIREKLPIKKLMITSPLPQEGKSFVASNLAQVFVRQQGRRVLVIDGDLRSPGMHRHFGAKQSPGLSEYLNGECDELAILQHGSLENLFFIPAGRASSKAPELISNGRLKLLLQRLESLFDWVIFDSSPVIPVSDSTLLAGFCDGVIMVVRANVTPSDLARRAREEFQDRLLLGVVLNGASPDETRSKYYYGAEQGSYT